MFTLDISYYLHFFPKNSKQHGTLTIMNTKITKTKGIFQGTWKLTQTMTKTSLNLNSNKKHKNLKQEHEVCKTKV
jgi:hypothetical protein